MIKKLLISSIAATISLSSFSADTNKDFKNISTQIRSHSPDAPPIKEIKKTPINGVLEVVTDTNEVFYITSDGKFILTGEILELTPNGHNNVTKNRIDELNKFNFNELKLSDAIVRKKGNGKSVIVTFEDPNCFYCRKLQPELDKLENVTIYTFIVPILGEDSRKVSESILCSSDKSKSWDNYLTSKTKPNVDIKNSKCDVSSLDRNIAFAKSHGISGTPALFFPNGKSSKGYIEATKIKEMIK